MYRASWSESRGYDLGCSSASNVAVEHQDDLLETTEQSAALWFVKHDSHQRYHRLDAGWMHFHAVEKSFHSDDRGFLGSCRTMQVEQDFRLGESRRHPVSRLGLIHGAAAVCDQFSRDIVNRKYQPPLHQPRPRVEAHAERERRLFADPSLRQIRMCAINPPQRKGQRRRNFSSFRNQFLLLRCRPRDQRS